MTDSFDKFPIGASVLLLLSPRSAPIRCKVLDHIGSGVSETTPGQSIKHAELLQLQPDDGGHPLFSRADQLTLAPDQV